MRRRATALVFALVLGTGVFAPVPTPPVAAAAGPSQVLAVANVIGSLLGRNRVYRNAAEVQDDLRAYYDELRDHARAALRDRELSRLDNQLAAYIRLITSLAYEENAVLQLLEDDKRGARQAFHNDLNRNAPSLILVLPGARHMAQAVRGDLGELRDALQGLRATINEARPSALLDIARRRADLDRVAGIAGMIGGRPGRQLADAVGALGAQLQRLEASTDAPSAEVDSGLDEAQRQLASAIDRLDEQLATDVRPSSVSLFGGLGQVRIPGRFAFFAAIAQALSATGSRAHGLTRDDMRERVHQFLVETRGAGLANLRDCFKASGAQLRAQFAGAPAPPGSTAAVLLETDLSTCDPQAIAAVLAAAAELTPPSTSEPDPTDTGPDATTGTTTDAGPIATEPAGPASALSGGGTHRITEAVESYYGQQTFCLGYYEQRDGDIPILLEACTDTPSFDLVYDLAAGTVAGSFSVQLSCPGSDRCGQGMTATGHVSGSFGPLPFGQEPQTPPPGYPFPAHHWYGDESDWWAGGPIELTVSIDGARAVGETSVAASASATVTGWTESGLWPTRTVPGELPTEWVADFGVWIDYGDSVNPRWDFYTGLSTTIAESAIALPPWH